VEAVRAGVVAEVVAEVVEVAVDAVDNGPGTAEPLLNGGKCHGAVYQ
jgi:hypothetical protein